MPDLTRQQLDTLGSIQTCAVANAIETFNIKPRNQGFMLPSVKCMFPELGSMIGYAVTGVITSDSRPSSRTTASRVEWVDEILKVPEPRVVVLKDLDYPRVVGSFWGEVQSSIHKALGCVGTVTDGGVRDLDEMREAGFFAFAGEVLVSHAYVRLVEFGVPVTVAGVEVNPGDIIMGDQHGVISVPSEIAADVPAAAARVEEREQQMIGYCKSSEFTPQGLKERLAEMYR